MLRRSHYESSIYAVVIRRIWGSPPRLGFGRELGAAGTDGLVEAHKMELPDTRATATHGDTGKQRPHRTHGLWSEHPRLLGSPSVVCH